MAKEIQDTLGEVDEMPISESATEGDDDADSLEANGPASDDGLAHEPDDSTELSLEGEVPNEEDAAAGDDDDSAPAATLALWLADELRPSPSKSLAPAAPVLESPETLAPVAVPPAELSEEDLAVLPLGARSGQSRYRFARVALAALGALAAVFLFSYLRRPAPAETVESATAAEPAPGDPTLRATAAAPGTPAGVASPTETTAEEPEQKQLRYWGASMAAPEADSDDPMRGPRGPSVGRFPDLPPEFWSEMRRRELESRAESAQPSATDPLEP